ncbi:MAG: UvrD-helicase domain-containing protein, partial [Gemmatimonadaceae bacterium]
MKQDEPARRYPARPPAQPPSGRDIAAELNAEQAVAATSGDGPLLVIAGAGTGKTRTLVYRVAHLIERGVSPDRILLLTFTRRAAEEMLVRAERIVGSRSRQVHGGTFHATAHRLLRRFGPEAGVARDFSIMDQGDAQDLMQLSRATLGYADTKRRFPKKETLHYVYSRHINTEQPVGAVLAKELPRFLDEQPHFERIF